MCPLDTDASASRKIIQGHNSRKKKVVKSEIKLGLPFMTSDIEYKFQMIC